MDLYINETVISNPAKTGAPGESKQFERVLYIPRSDVSRFEYSTMLCIDKPHRGFHPQGARGFGGGYYREETVSTNGDNQRKVSLDT